MNAWIGAIFLIGSILLGRPGLSETALSSQAVGASVDAVGTYSPLAIDSGIVLSIAVNKTFSASWWAQDMNSGMIVRGKIDGSWKEEKDEIVLYYDGKNGKGCICKFRLGKAGEKPALILTVPSDFPLSIFFGDIYYRNPTPVPGSGRNPDPKGL